MPIGVLRSVDLPTFESGMTAQIQREIDKRGPGDLEKLLHAGETWTVHEDGTVS